MVNLHETSTGESYIPISYFDNVFLSTTREKYDRYMSVEIMFPSEKKKRVEELFNKNYDSILNKLIEKIDEVSLVQNNEDIIEPIIQTIPTEDCQWEIFLEPKSDYIEFNYCFGPKTEYFNEFFKDSHYSAIYFGDLFNNRLEIEKQTKPELKRIQIISSLPEFFTDSIESEFGYFLTEFGRPCQWDYKMTFKVSNESICNKQNTQRTNLL